VRRYETIFILRPDLGEAQFQDNIKRFEGLVASGGGEILETDEWGFRELAYRIHNEHRGYYVRLDYAAGGEVMNEVERNLKLSDSVLRYLSVLIDPEVDVAKVSSEIEARRSRAAEAKAAAEARAAAAAAAAQQPPAESEAGDRPPEQSANKEESGASAPEAQPAPAETAGASSEPAAAAEPAPAVEAQAPAAETGGQAAAESGSQEPATGNAGEAAAETPEASPSGEPKQD
jgi:small subunit ribosomal protein S6